MKKIIIALLTFSSLSWAQSFQIETQIANDYVLFDAISDIRLVNSINLPQAIGSRATLAVSGDLAVRGCDYTGFAYLLQPITTGDLTFGQYNVTVAPLYQGRPLELSRRGCRSISLGIEHFNSTIEIVVREMLGASNKWVYMFMGTGGIKLRIIEIVYSPVTGWRMRDI